MGNLFDEFYVRFEEKFRGSFDLIKERQSIYLDIVNYFQSVNPSLQILDIGCGRGEWLQLLKDNNISSYGYDFNKAMVSHCNERGLDVYYGDAIEHLKSLEESSIGGVTGFQIVEHLPFEILLQLFKEAFRVLSPGGFILFETPNPENLNVGSHTFYNDPTHINPIPPLVLKFLGEDSGFVYADLIRLQPDPELAFSFLEKTPYIDRLMARHQFASRDYSVCAVKQSDSIDLSKIETIISDTNRKAMKEPETIYQHLDWHSKELDARKKELIDVQEQLEDIRKTMYKLDVENKHLSAEIQRIHSSTSWKFSFPIRVIGNLIMRLRGTKPEVLKKKIELKDSTYFPVDFNINVLPFDYNFPQVCEYSQPLEAKLQYRIIGHVESHYSLSIVNRGLATALYDIGENIQFLPWHAGPVEKPQDLPPEYAEKLRTMFNAKLSDDPAVKTVSIVHHYPYIHDEREADYKMIIFFWEETAVPRDIVKHICKNFDIVLVASSFVKKALRDSGCFVPIFVIPIGIDHIITPSEDPLQTLAVSQTVRLLHFSSCFERKGYDLLLKAYYDIFSAYDNVELYIKTFPNEHNKVRQYIEEYNSLNKDSAPRVIVDEKHMNSLEICELYKSSHAIILPTRGEGFNLPAAEALALGLPVIVTGYSGHADFCTLKNSLLVKYAFQSSKSHVSSYDSCWLEPDIESLKANMKKVYTYVKNNSSTLEQMRTNGIKKIKETYTWENSARSLQKTVSIFHKIQQSRSTSSKKVDLLSPWNSSCGISEYSKNMFSGFDRNSFVFTIYTDDRVADHDPENKVYKSWKVGDTDSVVNALTIMQEDESDIVFIQHQPALFDLNKNVIEHLVALAQKKIVIMVLHSTKPLLENDISNRNILFSLNKLDRIIVHSVDDVNNLLALGIQNNVVMIPHGIKIIEEKDTQPLRQKFSIKNNEIVIGTFGFLLEHKGVDTLIDSVLKIEKRFKKKCRLILVNSVLDERSKSLLNRYKEKASSLGVFEKIVWINDFLQIETAIDYLRVADYIIFPYKETKESASGAVTNGLSTYRPVLVSPIPIFDDVSDCSWSMEGATVDDIGEAIASLEGNHALKNSLLERQRNWIQDRCWENVTERIKALCEGLEIDRLEHSFTITKRTDELSDYKDLYTVYKPQILLDFSEMYFRDGKTGIQRVVKNIFKQIVGLASSQYNIRTVYAEKGGKYLYTNKFLLNTPGEPSCYQNIYEDEMPVQVNKGDIFFGLDLSAHLFPEIIDELEDYRRKGVSVHFLIHDLIPILYQNYCESSLCSAYLVWLNSIVKISDSLICVSESTASDVKNWISKNHKDLKDKPLVFSSKNGTDMKSGIVAELLSEELQSLASDISGSNTFLMVGTIEPRKGHQDILDAFDNIWEKKLLEDALLVIVGKYGWHMEEFKDKIIQHKEYGQKLIWLEWIEDSELVWLYENSKALIAASYVEGFGLPLVEAAQYSLPIIARDIPVFREVAGEHAYYFKNKSNSTQIANSICKWVTLFKNDNHPRSENIEWLTWEESTRNLLDILVVK